MYIDSLPALRCVLRALPTEGGDGPTITHFEVTADHNVDWCLVYNFVAGADDDRLEVECSDGGATFYWEVIGTHAAVGYTLLSLAEYLVHRLNRELGSLLVGAA